jgi:ABC-type lipoprotein release transport system permease subunit
MNLPLLFARRYLLAKRSTNAINVITGISIGVIAVVTAAMVTVLSAVNGITDLVDTLYSAFDQDITITPAEGKTFAQDALELERIKALPGVALTSWTIEENVLLRCGDQQAVATLKGVEDDYLIMSDMVTHIVGGEARLNDGGAPAALLGIGLKLDLDVPYDDAVFNPLQVSAPVRGRKLSSFRERAFETLALPMAGTFSVNNEHDAKYALVPLSVAAELLHYDSVVSALELKLATGARMDRTAQAVRELVGPGFTVRTRHQKNELMYRTNQSEKLVSFLVLLFIGAIGAFNIIASLTMMMIEKRRDMGVLLAMGATPRTVRRIFFHEGSLIVLVGTVIGLSAGLLLCLAQQRFGLVRMEGSVVEHYPVDVRMPDLLVIAVAVVGMGLLASWVPLRALSARFLQATADNPVRLSGA